MIQGFLTTMLRRYAMRHGTRYAMKGVGKAMSAGGEAWNKRRAAKKAETIEQDAAVTATRKRLDDERKGDEILYPTDDLTQSMQPRK